MDIESKYAAILLRRSVKRRDKMDGIKAQEDAVRQFAKYNGYEVTKVYKDDGKTGTNADRSGLQNLLRDAETGAFQYVLVWKIDRLARNVLLTLNLEKQLAANGVRIISVTEYVNDGSITAKEAKLMIAVQSETFIDRLRQNVMRGLEWNAKQSKTTGGCCAYGYDIIKKQYKINEFEAEAVRMAYAMYADGFPKTKICEVLNDKGYRTKTGGKFQTTSFDRIFENEKYIGTYRYSYGNGEVIENANAIPPIIDIDTFNRVQERNAIGRMNQNVTVPRNSYALSGLVKCAECGRVMLVDKSRTGRNKTERITFYCAGNKKYKDCQTKPVNMKYVNELITTLINRQIQDSFDTVKAGIAGVQGKLNANDKKRQQLMQQEIGKIGDGIKKLTSRLAKVDDEIAGVIETEISERMEQQRELEAELQTLANKVKPNITDKRLRELLSMVGAMLVTNGAGLTEKQVLHALIESVMISNDNIVVSLKTP